MSNVSLIALGINETREGAAVVQGGIAHIAEGICEYWFTPVRWSYGSGDNEVTGVTNLGDMFVPRRHEDGSVDGKFLPAMYRAVAENFGVDGEFTNADKVCFRRGFSIAAARNAGEPIKFVDASIDRKGRALKVRAVELPAGKAFKLADDEGALTDLGKEMVARIKSNLELEGKAVPETDKLLERASALKVACVGGKHPVLGKLPSAADIAMRMEPTAIEAGLMPAKNNRDRAPAGDKLIGACDFIVKAIDEVLGDGDEAGFAPSKALDDKLRGVAERIAAYFASSL